MRIALYLTLLPARLFLADQLLISWRKCFQCAAGFFYNIFQNLSALLGIRIRSDPDLFAGSGSRILTARSLIININEKKLIFKYPYKKSLNKYNKVLQLIDFTVYVLKIQYVRTVV
jgi:hypothetical protein